MSKIFYAVFDILSEIDDPEREGVLETPNRVQKFYDEWFTKGDPSFSLTSFDAEHMDQVIIQKDIPFYSLCEHHILPFFGTAIVAYLPREKIFGLSKLARLVDFYSRRLQNQERLTKQVAQAIMGATNPLGAGVIIKARHMCMEMRGIQKRGAETITSWMSGVFRDDAKAREELIRLAGF